MIWALLKAIRRAYYRFLGLFPYPDVTITLDTHPFSFNTRTIYYHTDPALEPIEIIRIHTVELNLFIPGDLVPDDEVLNVAIPGLEETYDVHLIDYVLYGLKWESTLQAVIRRIGLDEGRDFDDWVMGDGDYRIQTGEPFPFFDVTFITGQSHCGQGCDS